MKSYSLKTQVFNIFRQFFKISFLERSLAKGIRNHSRISLLLEKLVPNNYQYNAGSYREFIHNNLSWFVDVSDYIGHNAYFGLDGSTVKLFSLCDKNSVVFDVGVNIGWTALHMAKICEEGAVYGFEPDKKNYQSFQQNLDRNSQIKNLTVYHSALGASKGLVDITVIEPSNRGGNHISVNTSHSRPGEIELNKLDDYTQKLSLKKIDLIKIDTEGYELQVLIGAKNSLLQFNPTLYIEVNNDNLRRQGDSAAQLFKFLVLLGYEKFINSATGEVVDLMDNFENCHFDVIATR